MQNGTRDHFHLTVGRFIMTNPQKALVRYWFTALVVIAVLFWITSHETVSPIIEVIALAVVAIIDRAMRPPTPEGTPSPKDIIMTSRAWQTFIVLYGLAAVLLAALSIAVHDLSSWLAENIWIIFILIPLPIIGPVIQSQAAVYKAYGDH